MRSLLSTLIISLFISGVSVAQVSGTYSIPGPEYPSIASAIYAINTYDVGPGGITFNVTAGYTETFITLTAGLITTSSGSATSPIVFQKSGTGANPLVTGPTTAAGSSDYIFCIAGTDHVTFDGIDVSEPTGVTEWGYAVLKSSATNGAQNVIIRNCKVTLKNTNVNTIGIYSANVTPSAPTVQLTVSSLSGANSYNKFYSNTITGCYSGIVVNGYNDPSSPYQYYDQSNEIGNSGANTITGQGGGSTASYGILTSYQDRLVISNNLINGTVNGTGACSGIQMNSANNANMTVSNNTISLNRADATTTMFYGIYNNMGTSYTNNTCLISGNVISGCSFPKATSGNTTYIFTGISALNVIVENNQVVNNTYGSSTASATGTIYGIHYTGSQVIGTTQSIYGNLVSGNTRIQATPGSGTTYYMYLLGGGATAASSNVYNNIISNNSSASTGTAAGIYWIGGFVTKSCYNNTVENINNARGTIYGIYAGEGYSQYLYGNKIQNLTTLSTTATIHGIWLSGSSYQGPLYCYNNMVAELKTPASNSGTAIYGITANASGLDYLGLYNNTVYLDGTSSGTGFGTIGLYVTSNPKTADVRNNIVINKCVPTGSGIAVAFRSNAYTENGGITNYSLLSNNNNLYTGSTAANRPVAQIYSGSSLAVSCQGILDFKTIVWPRECYSISENTPFVNVTTTPYNLHIDPAIPSECESAGTVITSPYAVVNDIDGHSRFPNPGYPDNVFFPAIGPDIGADEYAGINRDVLAPAIIYTPLDNTSLFTNRTLTATITDLHGVPVMGAGLPRLAWKKSVNGSWSYVTAASLGNNQYSFDFGAGVSFGDTIYYFVVAQDMVAVPNVGTFPLVGSGGFIASPPSAGTPPASPNWYKIIPGVCGVKTVGIGKDYQTLTEAINDINLKHITCPVVLELTDNTYSSEIYPIEIKRIAGASSTNTLTIRPAPGKTPMFMTSYLGVSPTFRSMISLVGAQHVVIDGSNAGGSDRNLTLINGAGGGYAGVIGLYNDGLYGASNIVIKNCILKAHTDNLYNAQGITTYATTGNAGYSNLVIDNNEIRAAKYGLSLSSVASYPGNNIQVTNNIIGSMDAGEAVAQQGIGLRYMNDVLIQGNEIIGHAQGMTFAGGIAGILVDAGSTNVKIRKNIIHDFRQLGEAFPSGAAMGIYYSAEATSLTEITDNVIYNIKSPGQNPWPNTANPSGIFVWSGGNMKIQHNTISMQGNYLSATAPGFSACIAIRNNITNLDIRNNILNNSSQPVSGAPGARSYCMVFGNTPAINAMDYNDLFINGVGATIGYFNGTNHTTLSAWQSATGRDANSVSVNPVFASAQYLIPTTGAMPKAGQYITDLPTDITGITRTNPPDIGAYEFSYTPLLITLDPTDLTISSATLNGTVNPNGTTSSMFFDYGLTNLYGNTVFGTPAIVNGNNVVSVTAPITGLLPGTTYHCRIRALTTGGTQVYGNDVTFTNCPLPGAVGTITGPVSICRGQTGVVYSVEPVTGATSYNWILPANWVVTAGAGTNSIMVSFPANAASGNLSVVPQNSCGNGSASPDLTVTLTDIPSPTISGDILLCNGLTEGFYFTETGMTGYAWTVSGGGVINFGQGTSFIMVSWPGSGTYTVTVTYYNQGGCTVENPTAQTVMIFNPVIAGTIGSNQTLCPGNVPAPLTGSAPTGGATPYVYQWQMSADGFTFTDIPGASSLNYQPGILYQTTWYRLNQISSNNCGSVMTNMVTVTIFSDFAPGTISADQSICLREEPPALLTGTSPTGGATPYSYHWELSENGNTFIDIAGATDLNYQPNVLTTTTHFRLRQTSSGGCGTGHTNIVTITVHPALSAGSIAADQTIFVNHVPALLTGTEPTGGIAPYTYQWASSLNGAMFDDIQGATDLNYQPPALLSTTYFILKQTSSGGCGTVSTNMVTIMVVPQPYITVVSPNGGEDWVQGTTHNITWSGNVVANVKIELFKGGVFDHLIAASVPSTGTFTWIVPAGQLPGTDYKVKISSTADIMIFDFSNENFTISASNVPVNLLVQNVTIADGQDTCFNAMETITVAGAGSHFTVLNGGMATFIAGQRILFMPGTSVVAGGIMHGYISTEYCGSLPPAVAAVKTTVEKPDQTSHAVYRVYPNPTIGNFTIELPGEDNVQDTRVEIFSVRGELVLETTLAGNGKHEMSLQGRSPGLYMIRFVSGSTTVTSRIVLQ